MTTGDQAALLSGEERERHFPSSHPERPNEPAAGSGPSGRGVKHRIESLDYLRGIMATIVMLFHFCTLSSIKVTGIAANSMAAWSMYAVSAFYVLSGISLAIVYSGSKVNGSFLKEFCVKRFFRIAPLYWLASAVAVAILVGSGLLGGSGIFSKIDPGITFLNFSFLFSWLNPRAYIVMGGWSIGNEVFFYTLFPLMIFLLGRKPAVLVGGFLAAAAYAIVVAFFGYNLDLSLGEQWGSYINPWNQLYLFMGGVLIGAYRSSKFTVPSIVLWIAVAAVLVAPVILPAGDRLSFVAGWNRVAFSVMIFGLCLLAANTREDHHPLIGRVFAFLGVTSYSIYLLHPFVFRFVHGFLRRVLHVKLPPVAEIVIAIPVTFGVCYLSYILLEKHGIRLGRMLLSQKPRPRVEVPVATH